MPAPAFDTSTLSWVKDEIDLALEKAGEALARHAAAPDESKALDEARSHLHQACGALTIVGLAGVSHFAETIETHLAELADHPGNNVAVASAAGSALSALRRYLDDLMAGHPDQPLRLLPPYRNLALAAGQPEPSPLVLFYPDLTQRPPRRDGEVSALAPARAKALRLGFARGMAKHLESEARGLTEMRNAIAIIEQSRTEPAERALWWITLAWFEAQPQPAADLLAGLDRQLELLAAGSIDADNAPPALLARLLHEIAIAPAGSEHLESVRAAYRLADLIPAAASGIETRREACRAPLSTAMAEWDSFSQGTAIALMRFHDVALLLAASARDSHDQELARLAEAIAAFAAWLRQQPEQADTPLILEVASALVLVEDAIEQEGARNPVDDPLFAAEVDAEIARLDALRLPGHSVPPASRQRWRERQLVAQVAAEIGRCLEAAEPAIDAYFQSSAPTASLPSAITNLHQVGGAFRLLDESDAAAITLATEVLVSACQNGTASPDNFAAIADRMAALGQFAAALTRGQADHAVLTPLAAALVTAPPVAAAAVAAPAAPSADDEMLAIFIEEAQEVLAMLAENQPALRAQPSDRAVLVRLRRGFHTLKGSGRMVGLSDLGDAAYAVEKLLNRWIDARTPINDALQSLIERAQQLFGDWITALTQGQAAPDAADLIAHCAGLAGDSTPAAVLPASHGDFLRSSTFTPPPAVPSDTVTIGDLSLSATLYRLYVDEAQGHVATLRKEMAASGIPSRDLIRAAHTLAGISAGTGFANVQALAHALENALVRHSLAHVPPDESGRMLLARAAGALEGMVGAIAERRAPSDECVQAAALEALQPPPPPMTATQLSPLAERRQLRPTDEVDPQLAALFLEEADEQLHQLESDLRAWRAAPTESAIGQRLARLLHTFKGGARMCGAMGIGELAHSMETRIEQAMAQGGASVPVLDSLDISLERANHLVATLRAPAVAATASSGLPLAAPVAATAATAPTSPATAGEAATPAVLLRVRADLIDRLVNEAGELAIARSRIDGSLKHVKGALYDLTDNIARLRGQLREFEIIAETGMQSRLGGSETQQFDPLELDRFTRLQELTRMMAESVGDVATVQHVLMRQVESANEALAIQSRQNRELSHTLLRARMVPFTTVVDRLHRIVRQTAKELGRQANLDIQGGATPIDRTVLERMLGPLEHLLRNAVAHGIESPDQRQAAGKPELGQIVLGIVPTDNDITLTLADDGKGLDHAAIRRRAIERGLLDAADQVGDDALAELIFRAGFTTATTVNAIAGRGVGLDVVRDEVAQLGGQVSVGATAGGGTRFEIVLPLTLAVIPVMLVTAAGRSWAIPAALVEEARELTPDEAATRRASGGITRNNRRYPWHDLSQLFDLAEPAGLPGWQLLLRSGGEQIALEIEAVTQSQEVVVKSVGDMLARVPGLTGATVLSDGTVALIVNPVALAKRHIVRAAPASAAGYAVSPASTFLAPAVMVVDDSLTVRKITSRLLERAGYRVILAKDGVDALEQLEQQRPAVILADIEMPRMDGFELVRALRDKPALAALPVIMITSRIAERHRQIASELGVRHYLGKPYDEAELLGLIAALVAPTSEAAAHA